MRKEFLNNLMTILGTEDRGVMFELTNEEILKISNYLNLDDYDHLYKLVFLRNYIVLVLTQAVEKQEINELTYSFLNTVVKTIIDHKMDVLNRKA